MVRYRWKGIFPSPKVTKLENQRLVYEEKRSKAGRPLKPFDEMYRTAMQFVSEPYKIWVSGGFEEKRAVLKLVLGDRITYVRNEGYRTPTFSLPFKILGPFLGPEILFGAPAKFKVELLRPTTSG